MFSLVYPSSGKSTQGSNIKLFNNFINMLTVLRQIHSRFTHLIVLVNLRQLFGIVGPLFCYPSAIFKNVVSKNVPKISTFQNIYQHLEVYPHSSVSHDFRFVPKFNQIVLFYHLLILT